MEDSDESKGRRRRTKHSARGNESCTVFEEGVSLAMMVFMHFLLSIRVHIISIRSIREIFVVMTFPLLRLLSVQGYSTLAWRLG